MKTALAISLILCGCFPKNWSKGDQAMESVMLTTLTVDWVQTAEITGYCTESNPILGACGEKFNKDICFPIVIVGTMALTRLLPPHLRTAVQGMMIGGEAATTVRNYRRSYDRE